MGDPRSARRLLYVLSSEDIVMKKILLGLVVAIGLSAALPACPTGLHAPVSIT
jgi:hypothetical protein